MPAAAHTPAALEVHWEGRSSISPCTPCTYLEVQYHSPAVAPQQRRCIESGGVAYHLLPCALHCVPGTLYVVPGGASHASALCIEGGGVAYHSGESWAEAKKKLGKAWHRKLAEASPGRGLRWQFYSYKNFFVPSQFWSLNVKIGWNITILCFFFSSEVCTLSELQLVSDASQNFERLLS